MPKLNTMTLLGLSLLTTTPGLASDFYAMSYHLGDYIEDRPLEEYANRWWQWAFSIPPQLSPVRDLTGENCHQGQQGDVWYLAGGYGTSTIRRSCTVPAGKSLFFPVINTVYYPARPLSLSCEDAKTKAALNNDKLLSIHIEIDGISATNPAHTRLRSSDCFDLYGLVPKQYNAPKRYPAASDGYWVMLKPLSPGTHQLKFSASYANEGDPYGDMVQDIEYVLEVE